MSLWIPQLRDSAGFNYGLFTSGVRRFAWRLFKKLVIADRLRAFVAVPYDASFADGSGYSDMAIGLGQMFGLRFSKNFDYPYQAKSITEFWSRWQMSFSFWLRDYLFLPLAYRVNRALDGRLASSAVENHLATRSPPP